MSIFSVTAEVQDIAVLMGNVATAMRQWEQGQELPLDFTVLVGEVDRTRQRASQLRGQWNIDGGAVIHSTRPGLGPTIIRFQQIVRRLTWWFTEPILMQIRSFQMSSALTVDGLAQSQEDLLRRLQAMEAQLNEHNQMVAEKGEDAASDASPQRTRDQG